VASVYTARAFFIVFVLLIPRPLSSTLFPYTTLFRSIWGVRADTRLFGLTNVKTGKIEGFEIDLAHALTKQMLGKDATASFVTTRSEEHTSELQSRFDLVCRLLLEKKKKEIEHHAYDL